MNKELLLTSLAIAMGASMNPVNADTIGFDTDSPGSLPLGWTQGVTGRGAARWAVQQDESAPSKPNVLRQSGVGSFPWVVRSGTALENGYVEVRFKALAGKEDQAGGVIWRWKNGDSYYVARANALEDNVSLYYVEAGSRKTLKYVNAPVPPKVWHTLGVDFSGRRISVALNGKTYIELDDAHISGRGAVGMWTKADSVTAFDDFSFGSSKAPRD